MVAVSLKKKRNEIRDNCESHIKLQTVTINFVTRTTLIDLKPDEQYYIKHPLAGSLGYYMLKCHVRLLFLVIFNETTFFNGCMVSARATTMYYQRTKN